MVRTISACLKTIMISLKHMHSRLLSHNIKLKEKNIHSMYTVLILVLMSSLIYLVIGSYDNKTMRRPHKHSIVAFNLRAPAKAHKICFYFISNFEHIYDWTNQIRHGRFIRYWIMRNKMKNKGIKLLNGRTERQITCHK